MAYKTLVFRQVIGVLSEREGEWFTVEAIAQRVGVRPKRVREVLHSIREPWLKEWHQPDSDLMVYRIRHA